MKRVRTDSDVLSYVSGGWARAALPMMTGGAGVGLLAIAALLMSDRPAILAVLALAGVGMAIAGTIGTWRAFDRAGIVLDRARRRATAWRRRVVALSVQTRELSEFWTVLLCLGRAQTRFASRTVYVVGLHGEVGEPLTLHWHEDYREARHLAEELAEFVGLPFTDAAATVGMVHTPGAPDTPLRAARKNEPNPGAVPPIAMRCRVSWHGATLVLEEPHVGWKRLVGVPLLLLAALGVPCLGLGAFGQFVAERRVFFAEPFMAAAVGVGMLSLMAAVLVVSSLPQLGRRRIVEAGPAGLRFKLAGTFATTERIIRGEDLVELRIGLGHLCAITPREYRVICGRLDEPLSRAELEWLRDQLKAVLHSGAQQYASQFRAGDGVKE